MKGREATSLDARQGGPGRLLALLLDPFHDVVGTHDRAVDSAYRTRLLILLTVALALDYADRAGVGALGPDLKHAFHISNTGFGLVASAFAGVGALATVPAGILTDRARRTLVLGVSMVLWTLAMGLTGAAVTYSMLIGARVLLGAVTATARPMIASITGDVFEHDRRGRALGLIDSGELVGNGLGFLAAGAIAAFFTWRGVFWSLGAFGAVAAVFVWRVREPPRTLGDGGANGVSRSAERIAEHVDGDPDPALVLEGDQSELPLLEAARYVLRIRTNVLVIVAVAFTSLFFSAVRIFGVIFIVRQYAVGRSAADLILLVLGLGALFGMLAGGRIGDMLIHRGSPNGRLLVAAFSYLVAAGAFAPTLFVHVLWIGVPSGVLASAALIAPTAPLDAIRLDVVHPQLWGRAEATRNVFQITADAAAPFTFGVLSDTLAGGGIAGMRWSYLIGLALLVVAALCLLLGRRYYPRDVAAAVESAGRRT